MRAQTWWGRRKARAERSPMERVADWDALGRLPESSGAATLAGAEDAAVGGADVGFDAGVVDFFEGAANAADELKNA